MFEGIVRFFKKTNKKEVLAASSKETAKERLHLVLMQDRANVSADFLELMRQEIVEVIKKYIDIDESAMDVRLTNQSNEDGTQGAPALYANIPIINIKEENKAKKKIKKEEKKENKEEKEEIEQEKEDEKTSQNDIEENEIKEETKENKKNESEDHSIIKENKKIEIDLEKDKKLENNEEEKEDNNSEKIENTSDENKNEKKESENE